MSPSVPKKTFSFLYPLFLGIQSQNIRAQILPAAAFCCFYVETASEN